MQVLLRTYQTGGAVAVLSHTGDPNKGLRDWYENQKDQDDNMEAGDNYDAENGDRSRGLQRWSSIRDRKAKAAQQWDSVRRSISTDGNALKQNTIEKIRELRPSKSRRKVPTVSMNWVFIIPLQTVPHFFDCTKLFSGK